MGKYFVKNLDYLENAPPGFHYVCDSGITFLRLVTDEYASLLTGEVYKGLTLALHDDGDIEERMKKHVDTS